MQMTWRTENGFVTEVTVVSQEKYDVGPFEFGASHADGTLDAVIKSLVDIRESIPAEFRAATRCEINSVSSYKDSHYAQIEIIYQRPATDEEIAAVQADERSRVAQEQRMEREVLAALKAKYEVSH